jgi:predicted metal-binding membrane protein
MNLIGATAEHSSEKADSVRSTSAASRQPVALLFAACGSSEQIFIGSALIIFSTAAASTLYFARSMSAGMAMPGGWTMSMMWMRMPDQSAFAAAGVFTFMWLAMMVAMMLPSALPMLLVYRRVMLFRGEEMPAQQSWLVGTGYFAVWAAVGVLAYVFGIAIANATMRWEFLSRLVPFACGVALILGGAWQFTPWKFACLKHCRDPIHLLARHLDRGTAGGFRFGLHHGAYCAGCCWGLMLMLLALGVMNLAAMIAVAGVVAAEKLLARGELIARVVGAIAIIAGALVALRFTS